MSLAGVHAWTTYQRTVPVLQKTTQGEELSLVRRTPPVEPPKNRSLTSKAAKPQIGQTTLQGRRIEKQRRYVCQDVRRVRHEEKTNVPDCGSCMSKVPWLTALHWDKPRPWILGSLTKTTWVVRTC